MTSNQALVQMADDVADAVDGLARGTYRTTPAPLVYDLTGRLNLAAFNLKQVCEQMAGGLTRSLDEFDVYDRKGEPAESVAKANEHLTHAADLAHQLGRALEAVQTAINLQGHNGPKDTDA